MSADTLTTLLARVEAATGEVRRTAEAPRMGGDWPVYYNVPPDPAALAVAEFCDAVAATLKALIAKERA